MRKRGTYIIITAVVLLGGTVVFGSISNPVFLESFYPEFIAGFLGVLLGFGIGFYVEDFNDQRKGKALFLDLVLEIFTIREQIISLEKEDDSIFFSFPIKIWEMGLASGQFGLIDDREVKAYIYAIYHGVSGYNIKGQQLLHLHALGQYETENAKHLEEHLRELAKAIAESIDEFEQFVTIE